MQFQGKMMSDFKLVTPVAFIIFNRHETAKRVFEKIRQAKPQKLLVIADGPRPGNINDEKNCKITREIINNVDWDCEVIKNFSDINLGCKGRVSSGLDWAFNKVERAIILEDDCLPHESFFPFCQELLEKYKDDERIMNVSGINLQPENKKYVYSYYFSRYIHVWGWASWRRAWQHYDVNMKEWPSVRGNHLLNSTLENNSARRYWYKEFQKTYDGKVDTWDHQLTFTCWTQSGLTILPSVNLVSNIGFGAGALHTTESDSQWGNRRTKEVKFPLNHPLMVVRDAEADNFTQAVHYTPSILTRVINKLRKILRKIF
jgi:hypothetical protein